jgi:arsenate reductase
MPTDFQRRLQDRFLCDGDTPCSLGVWPAAEKQEKQNRWINSYSFGIKRKMEVSTKGKILFLCTGNSCRSQMAEAWTRLLKGDEFEAYSAGVQPKLMDPRAIKAMAEAGVDISSQKSKGVAAFGNTEFDYVITLCDNAREMCPYFPAKTRLIHQGFDEPPKLAENARNEEEAMASYRRVRDEIKAFVESLPKGLKTE